MVILRILLIGIAIPIYRSLYITRADRIQGSKINKWWLKNQFSWILALFVIAFSFMDTIFPENDNSKSYAYEELRYFNKDALLYELKINGFEYSEANVIELLRKFEHAYYAWGKSDYQEAYDALFSIDTGKDNYGKLYDLNSYVIKNNMGVVYFHLKRNKGFRAYDYFNNALELVGDEEPYRDHIIDNIFKLDRMVNTLD